MRSPRCLYIRLCLCILLCLTIYRNIPIRFAMRLIISFRSLYVSPNFFLYDPWLIKGKYVISFSQNFLYSFSWLADSVPVRLKPRDHKVLTPDAVFFCSVLKPRIIPSDASISRVNSTVICLSAEWSGLQCGDGCFKISSCRHYRRVIRILNGGQSNGLKPLGLVAGALLPEISVTRLESELEVCRIHSQCSDIHISQ
jgi:hypothetical protein